MNNNSQFNSLLLEFHSPAMAKMSQLGKIEIIAYQWYSKNVPNKMEADCFSHCKQLAVPEYSEWHGFVKVLAYI